MDNEEILLDCEERMENAVEALRKKFVGVRTGAASPALVENVRVEYYGTPTPLKQLANISTPEPQQLVIRPFDASCLKNVEKAIIASDLGLAPNNDGKLVRLTIPPLSGEQRRKLASKVKEFAEEQRVAIRNIRRDANKNADKSEKDKILSEDDRDKVKEEIQELTKKYENEVNELAEKKTKEVMD